MITWIASYPKSGNTWMKLFLKSYFNSENTSFSINSKTDDFFTVETFPVSKKFNELNINYKNFADIAKNWISMQTLINLNNKNNYIKTHNAMCSINNFDFTDNENTLGAIYIVRDPRDIAVSYSTFLNLKLDDTIDFMLSSSCYEEDIFEDVRYKRSIMGNWAFHYNSWKNYNSREVIIIKYEDNSLNSIVTSTLQETYEDCAFMFMDNNLNLDLFNRLQSKKKFLILKK